MARRIPWVALAWAVGVAAVLTVGPWLRAFPSLLPACPFKSLTGLPCATCGLTRCLLAFSAGRWAEAFHWHPVAWLVVLISPVLVGWDLWRAWRGHPYPAPPEHWLARVLVATLLLGTWALQLCRGI